MGGRPWRKVGGHESMGAWSLRKSPALKWSEVRGARDLNEVYISPLRIRAGRLPKLFFFFWNQRTSNSGRSSFELQNELNAKKEHNPSNP